MIRLLPGHRAAVLLRRAGQARLVHQTAARPLPYKDSQNRESLKPRATDGTRSGATNDVAHQDDAAFDPNKTRPEEQRQAAEEEGGGNPLEFSGANKDVATAKPESDSPARSAQDKKMKSGGSSPQKNARASP